MPGLRLGFAYVYSIISLVALSDNILLFKVLSQITLYSMTAYDTRVSEAQNID